MNERGQTGGSGKRLGDPARSNDRDYLGRVRMVKLKTERGRAWLSR